MASPLDRPRLRPGLAAARDDRDPFAVVVYDELRLSRQLVRVSAREFTWLQWLDGSHSLREVQLAAMHQSGGELLPIEPLVSLVEKLDAAMFLDGPRFMARLTGPIREPTCIGCYSADPDELRLQLTGYFIGRDGPGLPTPGIGYGVSGIGKNTIQSNGLTPHPIPDTRYPIPGIRLRALLAPHIDFARGGTTYAWAYKELAEQSDARLFVIVGTAHYSPARYTLSRQDFKTPLGVVPTDRAFVDRLVAYYGDGLFDDPLAHAPEHSIELEVVFLQYLFEKVRPIRIVPLLVGSFHDCVESATEPAAQPDVARMIAALASAEAESDEPVCYIISGDLAHLGPKFGDADRVTAAQLTESRDRDQDLVRHCAEVDASGYFRTIAVEQDARRICGLPPTYTVLKAARPTRGRLLHYAQYAHPRGHESVSFAGMAFYA